MVNGYLRRIAIENNYNYEFSNMANIIYKYYDKLSFINSLFIEPKLSIIVNGFDVSNNGTDTLAVLNILKKYDSLNLTLEFIQTKLSVFGLPKNDASRNSIKRFLVNLLETNEWQGVFKDTMINMMHSLTSNKIDNVLGYCSFCKLLFEKCNQQTAIGDSNGNNNISESNNTSIERECAFDIIHTVSNAIGIKYGLLIKNNESEDAFAALNSEELFSILKHLILYEKDLNLKQKLLSKFNESYANCFEESIKESIIDKFLRLEWQSRYILSNKLSNHNISLILNNHYVQSLLKQRLKDLKNSVQAGEPKFTWIMRNVYLRKEKECEIEMKQFLMSESTTYQTKMGKFSGIHAATEWANYQKILFHGYLTFTVKGSFEKSHVVMVKTRKHYQDMIHQYDRFGNKCEKIRQLINT